MGNLAFGEDSSEPLLTLSGPKPVEVLVRICTENVQQQDNQVLVQATAALVNLVGWSIWF